MVFSKDDLPVIVTCFTEKGWTGTQIAFIRFESARLLSLGYLARTCLRRRHEPFANLKDIQNVIWNKWHDVHDQTARKASGKGV